MLPPIGSIALPISFKHALVHHSARFPILAQPPTLIGVSIGLGTVIFAVAQLAQPFAAPLHIHDPEED
jgi:hypothetical protein